MLENNPVPENSSKPEKHSQPLPRAPLQSLYHENIPHPLLPVPTNPQLVKLYFSEIFSNLESCESSFTVSSDYFLQQTELNHTCRAFLVDWLISLHSKFRLLQETLYITINLIDRYLSQRLVSKKQLQLVGITALFIACKYEEIYPPNIRDFLTATEHAYTKQHIVKMEVDVLKVMNFQITFPTPWRFMEKYPDLNTNGVGLFAEYLLELGQVEFVITKYKASLQAASVIYLANLIIAKAKVWKQDEHPELQDCVKDFLKIFKAAANHPLTSVREKYLKKKLDINKLEQEA